MVKALPKKNSVAKLPTVIEVRPRTLTTSKATTTP